MNSAWGPVLYNKAAWNAFQVEVEEIPIFDYEEMLINDNYWEVWDNLNLAADDLTVEL